MIEGMRAFVTLVALMSGCASASRGPPVVVLSIDGLMSDYIRQADRHGLSIPHLRRLAAEGASASGVRGVLPSLTYPSHTTILTGVSPAEHGIDSNYIFDPKQQNDNAWYWFAEDIQVDTLWGAAMQAGLQTASVDWPVSIGAPVDWNIVQYWRRSTTLDNAFIRALSSPPGFYDALEDAVGSYARGGDWTVQGDARRSAAIAWILKARRPRFTTAYFAALDGVEHETGPFTPRAFAVIEQLDGLVGEVWAAARAAGGGQAVMCVVSDHGFVAIDKEVRLNAVLRDSGLITVDKGKITRWQAYARRGHGVADIVVRDGDPEVKDQVTTILTELASDPSSGVASFHVAGRPPVSGGFPASHFVVLASPGHAFTSDAFDGPPVRPSKYGGTHGHHPDTPGMDAAFLIAGPGVRKGDLGRIDMTDIAPTLAALLGIDLPDAVGRNLFADPR